MRRGLIEIIKQKGIGKYLGIDGHWSESIEDYELYVQLSLTEDNRYLVTLCASSLLQGDLEIFLYAANNKPKAEKIFDKILENDIKRKQSLVNKDFGFFKN